MKASDKDYICGFAAALSYMADAYDQPTIVACAIRDNGFSKADFVKAGVSKYDMDIFKKRNVWSESALNPIKLIKERTK